MPSGQRQHKARDALHPSPGRRRPPDHDVIGTDLHDRQVSPTISIGRPTDSEFYDALYSLKDYATEADAVHTLIQDRCPGARTLLDVACGTGKHLARLQASYTVEGLDLDRQLLAGARIRLPDVPLHAADMRDFDLGRRFDAITCLFGAIGYVRMITNLTGAVSAMARHLEPRGVLIIEPWYTPEAWMAQRPVLLSIDQPDLQIARMNVNSSDGRLAIVDFHYLVCTPAGVEHSTDHHEFGLFTDNEYRAAFNDAGLHVDYDLHGLTGRGLYIARPSPDR
jgi:SAM-dependent methyltransferase